MEVLHAVVAKVWAPFTMVFVSAKIEAPREISGNQAEHLLLPSQQIFSRAKNQQISHPRGRRPFVFPGTNRAMVFGVGGQTAGQKGSKRRKLTKKTKKTETNTKYDARLFKSRHDTWKHRLATSNSHVQSATRYERYVHAGKTSEEAADLAIREHQMIVDQEPVKYAFLSPVSTPRRTRGAADARVALDASVIPASFTTRLPDNGTYACKPNCICCHPCTPLTLTSIDTKRATRPGRERLDRLC